MGRSFFSPDDEKNATSRACPSDYGLMIIVKMNDSLDVVPVIDQCHVIAYGDIAVPGRWRRQLAIKVHGGGTHSPAEAAIENGAFAQP